MSVGSQAAPLGVYSLLFGACSMEHGVWSLEARLWPPDTLAFGRQRVAIYFVAAAAAAARIWLRKAKV